MVLEKTLESPLNCNEIKPVNPIGNQSWIFIGRIDAEAESPILWPPYAKKWLLGKDPDARKDWGQEEKGTTEDEMVGWHHRLWTWVWASSRSWWWTGKPGVLLPWGPWGHKESDTTEQLNWTESPSGADAFTAFSFLQRDCLTWQLQESGAGVMRAGEILWVPGRSMDLLTLPSTYICTLRQSVRVRLFHFHWLIVTYIEAAKGLKIYHPQFTAFKMSKLTPESAAIN